VASIVKKLMLKLGYTRISGAKFNLMPAPPIVQQTQPVNVAICAHMFWAYGELTQLEQLAASSFVHNGYHLKLWSYDTISNCPKGVTLCDAREILSEDRVFTYKNGSYAGFADLFRYALLATHGGLWADTDVIAIAPASAIAPFTLQGFWVSERNKRSELFNSVNNNVIYHPNPAPGDLIDLAYVVSERFDTEQLEWGDCGPRLLSALAATYPKLAPPIMEPVFANPLGYWECPQRLLKSDQTLPESSWFLHCYNEWWRRNGIDKNKPYPEYSMMRQLQKSFIHDDV
jgi:hypothetical protein